MPSNSEGGLQRSQRALSQAALSSSFTPLSSNDAGSSSTGEMIRGRRARSSSTSDAMDELRNSSGGVGGASWPFDSTFTTRGFDAARDPFAAQLEVSEKRFGGRGAGGKGARLDDEDGWWERLGVRASRFGGWTEGEGSRWGRGESGVGRPEEDEEDEEVEEEEEKESPAGAGRGYRSRRMPAGSAERTKLALAVWHDQFEEGEDPHSDYDYFCPSSESNSPFSTPSFSFTSLSMSNPSSPIRSRSLPLQSPPPSDRDTRQSSKSSSLDVQDLDDLTHSFLATQDRWGLFGLVEHIIEWPWSTASTATTPPPHSITNSPRSSGPLTPGSSLPSSSSISRVASSHSLALDMSTPARLDDGAWTEYGELSAYSRVSRVGGGSGALEWEGDGESDSMGDGVRRKKRGAVREGLGALMDVVGLGSFA